MRLSATLFTGLVRPRLRRAGPRRNARGRARLALAASAPALALLVAAVFAPRADEPAVEDAEYRARLRIARAARAEHPDRPLGVVLGSSRMANAFAPELLSETEGVYWVNGARYHSGPVLNRLTLHRLLRDGVRPDVVAVEVFPLLFAQEHVRHFLDHITARELGVVRGYADQPFEYDREMLRSRVQSLFAPRDRATGPPPCNPRGGDPRLRAEVTPEERAFWLDYSRRYFAPAFARVTVRAGADRALRDTLRTAADNGVRAVLLRAPEGPVFRSWYAPAALARFDAYLEGVAAEHGVPVVDARDWLEEDDFLDSHHALKRGAEKFTRRFARELAALPAR